MNSQTDWGALLLSADGRIARAPFLIVAAMLLGFAAIYEAVVGVTLHSSMPGPACSPSACMIAASPGGGRR